MVLAGAADAAGVVDAADTAGAAVVVVATAQCLIESLETSGELRTAAPTQNEKKTRGQPT